MNSSFPGEGCAMRNPHGCESTSATVGGFLRDAYVLLWRPGSTKRKLYLRWLLTISVIVGAPRLYAQHSTEPYTARLVYANDGDTCRIRKEDGSQRRIRLFGIDAPEHDQPFGIIAGNSLNALLSDQEIEVRPTGARTYGRDVARLYVNGALINEEMLIDGLAWHYVDYTDGDEAERFAQLESDARAEGIGLWSSTNPIRPKCWRRGDRDGDCLPDLQPHELQPAFHAHTQRRLNDGGRSPSLVPAWSAVEKFRRLMAGEKQAGQMRSAATLETSPDHAVYGLPEASDDRYRFTPPGSSSEVSGITILKRTAFTVGHNDRYRLPAWVAMRWTKDDYERGAGVSLSRPNPAVDTELPSYARGGTSFEYASTGLQRGHMARDDDMESWGADAVAEAMRMSIIVPQLEGRNHAVWSLLEDSHKLIVSNDEDDYDLDAIWIIAGPIFYDGTPQRLVGTPGTGVPDATYKIIAWNDANGQLTARAYVIDQLAQSVDLWEYLVPIDEVESLTGLDFFSDAPDADEDPLEAASFTTLWQ